MATVNGQGYPEFFEVDPDRTQADNKAIRDLARHVAGTPVRTMGHVATGLNIASTSRSLSRDFGLSR